MRVPLMRSVPSSDLLNFPCNEEDPELWFAERPEALARAQMLCASCPIQAACLDDALRREEPWGVWGGQILMRGRVIAQKRGRGRPRNHLSAA
jgi:WhiB family redox-sensing transcriptional regulator